VLFVFLEDYFGLEGVWVWWWLINLPS
jgi:hypothetical protein